jgi:hypothetical protein
MLAAGALGEPTGRLLALALAAGVTPGADAVVEALGVVEPHADTSRAAVTSRVLAATRDTKVASVPTDRLGGQSTSLTGRGWS